MLGKLALGKYRLLQSLGSGSNAEVFLAEPADHPNYRVVVKRVHDHIVTHPKFRKLFDAEVRSMANFSHPYAVRLLDASADDPIGPCMVMEYVPGITLEEFLLNNNWLHPIRVGRLLAYLCHALQAAHSAGIIHRDLKPANLMVTDADTPSEALKVMDFGFAGFADKPHIQIAELTGCGPIYAIGTPGYVSPEMIRGDTVDSRSDLYSVGVILFEMLTARLPFDYEQQDELLTAHIKEYPPRFHRIGCGHVCPRVEGVVQLALAKYPNERPQSARELSESFDLASGENAWELTAPADWEAPPARSSAIPMPAARKLPATRIDPYQITEEFEAFLPERLAAAKLRGFIEDLNGTVLSSDPGLVRLQVGPPGRPQGWRGAAAAASSAGCVGRACKAAQEPIEIDLNMDKPDPSQPRLSMVIAFRPVTQYPPRDPVLWRQRCEKLNCMLRQYMGV